MSEVETTPETLKQEQERREKYPYIQKLKDSHKALEAQNQALHTALQVVTGRNRELESLVRHYQQNLMN